MSNFFQNLFGSIGYRKVPLPTNMDFIPNGINGEVIQIKGGEPGWMGLETAEMQYWAYCFCSPLAAVIDGSAEADINGQVEFLKNDGSDDYSNSNTSKRLKKLFNQPNPLQTWEDFRGQQVVFKKVFGYCPVFVMTPSGHDVTESSFLWNLNPYFAKPKRNDNFSLYKNNQAIESWAITIFGTSYTIPSEKVFILKDGHLDSQSTNVFLPLSKTAGLEWAISNICAAMEADNVLLRKKGPLGFISHDPKPDTVAGYVPMKDKEKKEIQENLQEYGLTWSQFQYVVSKLPIRWNPMSFNVKDLMTKETTRQGIEMICDRFGYPAELMSGKNATYENRNSAEKFFYQNNVIPSSLRDMRQYNYYFKLDDNKINMVMDFDHLPVLQEDIVKKGESEKAKSEAYLLLFQNSVIHLNQYRTLMGVDTVDGDDVYYAEYQKKYDVKPEPLKVVPPSKKEAA